MGKKLYLNEINKIFILKNFRKKYWQINPI